jgi:hypothetical protein
MIKIFLLFFLPLSLFASKILSYNIYDRTDRADIMITFDVPYDGIIKKIRTDSTIIIKLQDASIESSKLKKISSKYIKKLAITPLANYVQLVASVSDNVTLQVSKTSDAYGLRLRFLEITPVQSSTLNSYKTTQTEQTSSVNKTTSLSSLPTKKVSDMTESYYIVMVILVIGILILFIIKKKLTPKNNSFKQANELNLQNIPNAVSKNQNIQQDSEVSIRFQKNIDDTNSVVMLDFLNQSYLVIMGSNNVLLDRFSDDKPTSQEEFNIILQDHQQMLDNFLNNQEIPKSDDSSVKSYSQKASTISYNV